MVSKRWFSDQPSFYFFMIIIKNPLFDTLQTRPRFLDRRSRTQGHPKCFFFVLFPSILTKNVNPFSLFFLSFTLGMLIPIPLFSLPFTPRMLIPFSLFSFHSYLECQPLLLLLASHWLKLALRASHWWSTVIHDPHGVELVLSYYSSRHSTLCLD